MPLWIEIQNLRDMVGSPSILHLKGITQKDSKEEFSLEPEARTPPNLFVKGRK